MTLARRAFLQMAAFGCACCSTTARALAEAAGAHGSGGHSAPGGGGAHPHWSYEGDTGPAHWGELQPDFKVCQLGLSQTPVDLRQGVSTDALGRVEVDYRQIPLRILNNGHTIQVNAEPGSGCVIDGVRYELVQFHFHHPSEHLLSGKPFDLEAHFVHRSAAGQLAVLGVFVKPGSELPGLQPIWDAMPQQEGPEQKVSVVCNPSALLPTEQGYFRYMGSLTTPPCSEGLTWTVFKTPLEASPTQIRKFASLFPNNARPVQGQNRRFILDVK